MARYEHLPIYKQALDAAVHFEKVVAGFSRYHKYTLGTELRSQSRAALALIVRANCARDRASVLVELRQCLDELLILLRLAKEVRASAFRSRDSMSSADASGRCGSRCWWSGSVATKSYPCRRDFPRRVTSGK